MKFPGFGTVGLLAMMLGLAAGGPAQGEVVLRIDISNPAEVRFIATGAFAENDDLEDTYLSEGFTLLGLFTSTFSPDMDFFDESTLRAPGGNFAYTMYVGASLSGSDVDLNISGSGFSYQDFSTGEPAFTGFASASLASWLPYLTPGRTGDIRAGDFSYNTVVIGQYEVVPEPTTWGMIAGGGLLLGLWALRKRRMS